MSGLLFSGMAWLVAKATVAIALALVVVLAARHARASLRHAVLSAAFALLLLLPLSISIVPKVDVPVKMETAAVVENAPPVASVPAAASVPQKRISLIEIAKSVYFAGVALMLLTMSAGVWRLRRWAADGEVWLDGTRLATDVACSNGIRRAVLVVLSDEVSVPLTFGFRRQTIVMPSGATEWTEDAVRRAFRHELEHVRRDDWAQQLVARVATALWWPHPLVWVAWRRFCLEAERACDDAVVRSFEPSTYASQLVTLARSLTRRTRVPALAMASPSRLAERVRAILDPSQQRGPHGRIASSLTMGTMLIALIAFGSVQVVAQAVQGEVRARATDDEDYEDIYREAVIKAAQRGSITAMTRFIEEGLDVNTSFDGDGTPLLIAARHGQLDLVRYLLDHDADPDVPSDGDGTPLIVASARGHIEVMRLLLDHGADVDLIVPGDENAIINAAWRGQHDAVRLLIEHGADVNARAWDDGDSTRRGEWRTALKMARRSGDDSVVSLLLSAGARD